MLSLKLSLKFNIKIQDNLQLLEMSKVALVNKSVFRSVLDYFTKHQFHYCFEMFMFTFSVKLFTQKHWIFDSFLRKNQTSFGGRNGCYNVLQIKQRTFI